MGLDQLARQSRPAALRPPAARPRRLPQASPPPRRALRRSARNSGAAAEKIAGAEEEAASSSSDESEPEYASSGVLRYVIEHSEAGSPKVAGPPAKNARASAGELRRSLECAAPQLARSYGVDVARGLLAAGGKDGVVAVWGLDSRGCVAEGGCARVAEPLLCAALHRSWVCDVQLVSWLAPDQGGEGAPDPALAPPALLTGGNDGYLRLWDLGASAGGRPRPLVEEGALHRSGVFSAHAHAAVPRVLSGSKDGTVCLSEGWERGGAKEVRRWEAGGVVKTLRWREMGGRGGDTAEADAFTFAFGGNDRVLRVCDTRADAGLELDLAHATALGCLRWSPRDPNLILSASHDPAILVHDLRAPKEPLLSLGVLHAKGKRLASITQPAWVAGGRCIAVPTASGSALALHCGASGALLSCGELGFAVGATHGDRSSEGLWVSGPRAVHHLQPA